MEGSSTVQVAGLDVRVVGEVVSCCHVTENGVMSVIRKVRCA